ncbi:cyclodeaminase [Salinivibrio costicola]|uniref:Cyclodeaminase n=1 Tax=Salinivibrio costicola TaxID=51367 RepID=A0ABX6K9B3_SALCS|nr:cyclodeaminase [Salinivibrio costicola]QIR06840.1 cyclodeaminase [Salinivibrio costicola]
MQLFHRPQIEAVTGLDRQSLGIIEEAFIALGRGEVTMPPVLSMAIAENNGEVDVKTAHIHGAERFAIKVSPGFFNNPQYGLPSLNGLMVVFSAKTGMVDAVLFDDGYLTDIRTALAGAVSAKYCARDDATEVAVIGAGKQARLQVAALTLVRDITTVHVWARDEQQAQQYKTSIEHDLSLAVHVHTSANSACQEADIIVTTTPATKPVIYWEDIPVGAHITAMGADSPEKRELAPEILQRADWLVVDRRTQSETLGELKHLALSRHVEELGKVVASGRPLCRARNAITVCDLTGTGVQDTAIANATVAKLVAAYGRSAHT